MAQDPSAQPTVCPSAKILHEFRSGMLPPDTSNEISTHIAGCPHCQTLLNQTPPGPVNAGPTPESVDSLGHETVDWTTDSFVRVLGTVGEAAHEVATTVPVVRLGQYRLVRVLGQGGMGAVCLGYHLSLKKWVAVKLLPRESTLRPGIIARFQREMEAIGQLDHPNIVRATDAGELDGIHYLVMELVDGADLNRLAKDVGLLSVPDACEMIREAAVGLQYAHERGMVHRDIKPSNLILSRNGQVKVLDLGLALLGGDRLVGGPLTGTGQVMGTLNFMAPEQWEAASKVDIRADLYSLGCTLHTLLTGRPPFGGVEYESALQKMAAHARAPIPRAGARRPEVPEALDNIIARMMAKSPADRFATPREVADALEPFVTGASLRTLANRLPVLTLPDPPRDEPSTSIPSRTQPTTLLMPSRAAERNRWVWPLTGTVFSGLVIAVVLLAANKPGKIIETPKETVTETVPEDEDADWPPLEKHNLLGRKPVEFHWWNPKGDSTWNYDAKKQQVQIMSSGTALLAMGRAKWPSYQVRISFRQTNWGGAGVFLGGRPTSVPGESKFQVVHLRSNAGPDGSFAMFRSRSEVLVGANGVPGPVLNPVCQTRINFPGSIGHTLSVTVENNLLTEVTWDGLHCETLCQPPNNEKFTPEDYGGTFGLWFSSASAIITAADFTPFERPGK